MPPMFRLTRDVRFAVNEGEAHSASAVNGFGGIPPLRGLGHFFRLEVTLGGSLQPETGYLRNIKEIDSAIRRRIVPLVRETIQSSRFQGGANIVLRSFDLLKDEFSPCALEQIRFWLSPYLALGISMQEHPMVRLSQTFEFCASHRLNNPAYDSQKNGEMFGKCNNPNGHGHNYVLQVTISGQASADGVVMAIPSLEQIVSARVLEELDHKNLNLEVPEFATLNPTVENIAMVIFRRLKQPLSQAGAKLAAVTVWETPRTCCEYAE